MRVLVPLTALLAGLLFAASATTAHGTDLRAPAGDLPGLIAQQQREAVQQERQAAALRAKVAEATAGSLGPGVSAYGGDPAAVRAAAGMTPVGGPGLTVSLDDAPHTSTSSNADDLVVHQQDVQAVVNALWAGGAEAMTLMGQRVVSTSAVRCVGNTLLLHGQVYSPPFVVAAVGDVTAMRASLATEPGVLLYQDYVARFGLGFSVRPGALRLPAYDGPLPG